jgi:hypothetical protein
MTNSNGVKSPERRGFGLAPALIVGAGALTVGGGVGCVPKPKPATAAQQQQSGNAPGGIAPGQVVFAPPVPPAPPANPVPPQANTGNVYTDRFLALWVDMHKLSNGYFSPEGIPYHSVETLLVEAPDHGHETTSEAYSYWLWLEAMYGKVTGDFSHLQRAWANLEYYLIPQTVDQPTNKFYPATKPATYADERDVPNEYPVRLDGSVVSGKDPIADELKRTYKTPDVFAMHWLMDVDNWYGYGRRGQPNTRAALINTFQRGMQESVWEAVTHPCWEEFKFGRPQDGFLGLFTAQASAARQWKYSAAPDADLRAVQAMYWAKRWADEAGAGAQVDPIVQKTAMLGDYARYTLFDKYFKSVPCKSKQCPPAKGYESSMWLVNWYFAWGGSMPTGGAGWAWRIGSSHNHQGYQNPMAAWALAKYAPLKPQSPSGARDWGVSLTRQLEFYRWLQAKQGGIAGGATNSWRGRYENPPADLPSFYGMAYDWSPVFMDPPSNDWFGFQVWSMQRVAEYYYVTADPKAELVLKKWVKWAMDNTTLKKDSYEVPSTLQWSGKPELNWDLQTQNWKDDPKFNSTLEVKVTSRSPDVGTAAGLVHTLVFYAARAKDDGARILAKELLDRMWNKYRSAKGITTPETRTDYKRFGDSLFIPQGWSGKMPSGATVDQSSTFVSIRPRYKEDPDWSKVQAYMNGGPAPQFTYHRFWAQSHIALAYATYGWLFPKDKG